MNVLRFLEVVVIVSSKPQRCVKLYAWLPGLVDRSTMDALVAIVGTEGLRLGVWEVLLKSWLRHAVVESLGL